MCFTCLISTGTEFQSPDTLPWFWERWAASEDLRLPADSKETTRFGRQTTYCETYLLGGIQVHFSDFKGNKKQSPSVIINMYLNVYFLRLLKWHFLNLRKLGGMKKKFLPLYILALAGDLKALVHYLQCITYSVS